MSIEEIIEVMSRSEGHRVKCVEKDGETWTGLVEVYESDYDNEDDENGGHSICALVDGGPGVLVYDSEIESISIID